MRQTWRWFGPHDEVSIDHMLQAGVEGVVSALHHQPAGANWPREEIAQRQREIATRSDGSASGLKWEVVESLPVSEAIKTRTGPWRDHIAAYRKSLTNLAEAGLEVICYNFMPVLDWTRTDLVWRLPHGGTCMRFDLVDFAAFDIHILERSGAEGDYDADIVSQAKSRFEGFADDQRESLSRNILAGLPGSAQALTRDDIRHLLATYERMTPETLRDHFIEFLAEVAPLAQELGLRLCCHPDDPPFPLLGLPRIMSRESDYKAIMDALDIPANGITLCSGSLGARPDNDLPGMMQRLGDRVHFLHLRNVTRQSPALRGSFHESDHLGGDVDMVALVTAILEEQRRRKAAGRSDAVIPMRPDHGHQLLDDLGRSSQPGYPAIGRLRGLAELRGVMAALSGPVANQPE